MLCFPKERGVRHLDPTKPNLPNSQQNPHQTIVAFFGTLCPVTLCTWPTDRWELVSVIPFLRHSLSFPPFLASGLG